MLCVGVDAERCSSPCWWLRAGAGAVADDDAVVVVVDNEVLFRNCCEGWGVGLWNACLQVCGSVRQ